MGYESQRKIIELNKLPLTMDITLKEIEKELGEVIISVSTFAAGDESKSAVLSTLDMATSSGGFGDIMPKKDELFSMAYTSGVHFSATKKWERTAFSTSTSYNNMKLLYKMLNSNIKWEKAPVSISENLVFRQKIGRNGMLKAMGAYGYDNSAMYYRDLNKDQDLLYALKNHNFFGLVTYIDKLGEKWILHSGITWARDHVDMGIQDTATYKKSGSRIFIINGGRAFYSRYTKSDRSPLCRGRNKP